ncbi:MAG: hypothetical protein ABEJ98_03310, partial [Candidatus Nanohaloarchaea archaeon]
PPEFFQVVIASMGIVFAITFADSLDMENPDRFKVKMIGILTLYSLSLFSLLVPATTKSFSLAGVTLPPVQVWFEATILGFLISAVGDAV